jgi:adenylate cyclase
MHFLSRHRILILAAICAFWTLLMLLGHFFPAAPFLSIPWRGEQSFEDLLRREGSKTATREDFVFLGIDQSTLEMPPLAPEELANNRAFQLMTAKQFPWSREVWAILLDKLFAAGTRLVMFDFVFNPPNEGDGAFHDALEKYHDRVVLGANVASSAARADVGVPPSDQIVTPNEKLIAPPAIADNRVGYVNFWPDPTDGKVRAANFTISDRQLAGLAPFPGEDVFESFAARALEKLGHAKDVPRDQRAHLIRFSRNDAYEARSLYEIFDPKLWHANYKDGSLFQNKVVLIGAASQIAHDFVVTPMRPDMPGPVLHLQTMAAAMQHEFLRAPSLTTDYALLGAAGVFAWVLIAFVRRPFICILTLLGATAAYLVVARIAYDRADTLVFTVPVLGAFLLSGLLSLGLEYMIERVEKLRTRRTLERYVSKNLVKEILDNPGSFYSSLRGVRIPATVLFSDVVGFTALTENADPEALVRQLNEYLSRMTEAVFDNGGTLDKFIGDAVMAVWGNVRSRGRAEDAKSAARAALAMRRELWTLNQRWFAEGIVPFAIGIGINQGDVLVGNIGSQQKADPTVIGDAVNLASRLEGLTRTYGVDILLGPSATELVRDEFYIRSVARVQVKGKTEPAEISALLGPRNPPFDENWLRALAMYEEGFRKFRTRDFADAGELFAEFLKLYPEDVLANTYYDRAVGYQKEPPNEAWNAVEVFKQK